MEIRLIRGTTLTLYVSVKPSGSETEFIPEPDDVFRFGVKKNSFEDSYVISRSYASTAYDPDNGYLAIELKPVDTISLNCGDYVFDVGLERGNDYYTLINPSKFTILPNITEWSGEPPEIVEDIGSGVPAHSSEEKFIDLLFDPNNMLGGEVVVLNTNEDLLSGDGLRRLRLIDSNTGTGSTSVTTFDPATFVFPNNSFYEGIAASTERIQELYGQTYLLNIILRPIKDSTGTIGYRYLFGGTPIMTFD